MEGREEMDAAVEGGRGRRGELESGCGEGREELRRSCWRGRGGMDR